MTILDQKIKKRPLSNVESKDSMEDRDDEPLPKPAKNSIANEEHKVKESFIKKLFPRKSNVEEALMYFASIHSYIFISC